MSSWVHVLVCLTGWGVAYHINGIETPVLEVERCKPYTFNVQVRVNLEVVS